MEARQMLENGDVQGSLVSDPENIILQKKYAPLLEGISDPWTRRIMARLYENQVKHLGELKKSVGLMESSTSANIPDLVKFTFPVIRKVWANLLANGLFSVQPMNSPIGGIFYWDYKYGTSKGNITAGQNMIENFDRWYSSEFVDSETVAAGPGTNFTGTLSWNPVKAYGLGQVGVEFLAVAVSDGSQKRIYDGDGTGTLTGDTGAASTITHSSGAYDITFDESVTTVTANYYFEMEGQGSNVPQVNVDISLEAIKAINRRLKIQWSSNAADDMRAVLGMDIEPELTNGVAQEIALGIDREMIMAAYGSGTTNTATFDAAVPPGRNQVDHYRNITTVMDKVSGLIHKNTRRGPANFAVVSTDVEPVLSSLATHGDLVRVFNDLPNTPEGQGTGGRPSFPLPQAPNGHGIYAIGWLQRKWLILVDPYFPSGKILLGLKGTMFVDSGLVYAPYVPLEMTQAFLDPADWSLRKGLRTRYNKKLVNNKFYGVVTVTNLP